MKKTILSLVILLAFFNANAQQLDSVICPEIKLSGPVNNTIDAGKDAIINVKPFKSDFLKTHSISYEWVVVNANIIRGEDKRFVFISTKNLSSPEFRVAVTVKGLDGSCPSVATMDVSVIQNTTTRTEVRVIRRLR